MELNEYNEIKNQLTLLGYGWEFVMIQNRKSCPHSYEFFNQFAWVVLNSGMKNQVAELLHARLMRTIESNGAIDDVIKHPGKNAAIKVVYGNRHALFNLYSLSEDKLAFLQILPWIGPITKYHLARNLGHDVCKPDRHLVRISDKYDTTPQFLCQKLADDSGDRIGTVDVVLWRAANLGIL